MSRRILTSFDVHGMPVVSAHWDNLQDGIDERFVSILNSLIINKFGFVTGQNYILWGLQLNTVGSNYVISSGAVFSNGEIFQYTGGVPFPVAGGIPVANVFTTFDAVDPIQYQDLSSHSPHQIRTVKFVSGASGTGTLNGGASASNDLANFINLSVADQTPFQSLAVATGAGNGTVTGTIYYKKDNITNSLKIYGNLQTATPADFNDIPTAAFLVQQTLPVGYRPNNRQFIRGTFILGVSGIIVSTGIKNAAGDTYIQDFLGFVDVSGDISIKWIKPDAAYTSYDIGFTATIFLD